MGWKAQGEALGLEHLALQPAGCSSLEAGGRGPSQCAPLWASGPGEPSSGEGATPTALIALIPRKGSSGVLLLMGGPKVLPTCACSGRLCKAREQNKLTVPQGGSWPAALWGGSGGGDGAVSWGRKEGHLGRFLKARLLCQGLQLRFCPAPPMIVPAPYRGDSLSLPYQGNPLQLWHVLEG